MILIVFWGHTYALHYDRQVELWLVLGSIYAFPGQFCRFTMKNIVVEIQFLKTHDTVLTPKETAVFDGIHVAHYVFTAPFPALDPKHRGKAKWLMQNHHCITLAPSCFYHSTPKRLNKFVY